MKSRGKIALSVVGGFILIIVLFCLIYILIPYKTDFGTFASMRTDTLKMIGQYDLQPHNINREFTDYKVRLNPLLGLMFKAGNLGLSFETYQSDKLERTSISQLEIGKNSGTFFDFTFMARPVSSLNAPFFHADALRALPGVSGALYMDFYSLNDEVDLEQFFGTDMEKLRSAMKSVQQFWKTEGFGELTAYMDEYKSPYRIEILEPENADEETKAEYFKLVYNCFFTYLDVYLRALDRAEFISDSSSIKNNEKDMVHYVRNLYENDLVVDLGMMMFEEDDFDRYLLEGFWGIDRELVK